MKPTIVALWHGTLSDTNCFVYTNPVMDALEEDLESMKTKLTTDLRKEQAALFSTYESGVRDLMTMRDELAFINGFRVAARLLAEVYAEER